MRVKEPTALLVYAQVVPVLGPEGHLPLAAVLQVEVGIASLDFSSGEIRPALLAGGNKVAVVGPDVHHVAVKMPDGPHRVWGVRVLEVEGGALGGQSLTVYAK